MALDGHILLGNQEFARVDGLMPVANFYPGQALRTGSLDLVVESCPEWRPRGVVVSNHTAVRQLSQNRAHTSDETFHHRAVSS
jgi:hypothetical protein